MILYDDHFNIDFQQSNIETYWKDSSRANAKFGFNGVMAYKWREILSNGRIPRRNQETRR